MATGDPGIIMNANLQYLDPFGQRQPEQELRIMHLPSMASCMTISPHGWWLAIGHQDGLVSVWSLESHRLCWQKRLSAAIVSLTWYEDLVAIKKDSTVERVFTGEITEGAYIYAANENLISDPDLRFGGELTSVYLHETILWVGDKQGRVSRYDTLTEEAVSYGCSGPILSLRPHPKHPYQYLYIANDRSIRVYQQETLLFKLADAVDRWPWQSAGYSHDGDLIYGLVQAKGKHLIYLWHADTGLLLRQLEGSDQNLIDAQWHPNRPALLTLSPWQAHWFAPTYWPPRWIALVPGLEETERNVYYRETEDEFDYDRKEVREEKPEMQVSLFDSPLSHAERQEQSLLCRIQSAL